MHIQAYFRHISCISFACLPNTVYIIAYFVHFLHVTIFFAYFCRIHSSQPCSGLYLSHSSKPTTIGQCALFIACKLMRIRQGMANQGHSLDQPTGQPHLAAARHAQQPPQHPPATAAFVLLLLQDKVAMLAEYTCICNICNI